MKAIYLTGFMGAGKTTIGKKLGKALKLPVIDTDQYIEEQVGKTIADIFAEYGEEVFRKYERDFLKQLPTSDVIVTTGGGIVIQKDNRNWMKEHGHVVYLHSDINTIFERVKHDSTRPLFDSKQKENTVKLYTQRIPFYEEAQYKIDTSSKSFDEIVNNIKLWLQTESSGNNN
ncbi:shikimate kinase [Fredinandcohnia sp. 179-A 10B2 NHS]|uniref:shikimate kinase n=1 Tax=Fredinandcohnia sp. 179-A 10B2 NHS TaxID=3235176 RepID=UPI0039A29461